MSPWPPTCGRKRNVTPEAKVYGWERMVLPFTVLILVSFKMHTQGNMLI